MVRPPKVPLQINCISHGDAAQGGIPKAQRVKKTFFAPLSCGFLNTKNSKLRLIEREGRAFPPSLFPLLLCRLALYVVLWQSQL